MIILKILLWLILSVFFLLLLGLVLILTVPLRYRIRAAKLPFEGQSFTDTVSEKMMIRFGNGEEEPSDTSLSLPFEAEVWAGFLAKIFQLQLGYVKEGYFRFLIFGKDAADGKPKKNGKKPKEKKKSTEKKQAEAVKPDEKPAEAPRDDAPKADAPQDAAADPEASGKTPAEVQDPAHQALSVPSAETPQEPGPESEAGSEKTKEPLSEKADRLLEKIGEVLDKADYYLDLLADNAEGIRQVMSCLFRVLKKIFPRRGQMQLQFGLADPYDTGRVLAVWSVLEPALVTEKRQLQVEADFERKRLEADGWMEGHFSLGGLAAPLVGALLHKPVRRLIRTVLRLSGRGKQKKEKKPAEKAA